MEFPIAERGKNTASILCFECGTEIEPNSTNMCVPCLRGKVDITEGIPKQTTLFFCRNCERYLQPPSTWVSASLESRELLAICLKKLTSLSRVNLVDAGFLWTEPHSKRINVKISVQKEVMNGAVLQQTFVVEYIVKNQMCEECHRVEAKDFWRAVVQIRQKVEHKKTFYYLEQLMLKHRAHSNTVNIKPLAGGLDFFYGHKQDGRKLVDYLMTVVPCKYQTAQELMSHDPRSNIYDYKSTFSVEIVPICKDDLVCLPLPLAKSLGNIAQIVLCYRVTQTMHFIDPATLQIVELSSPVYWRHPFSSLATRSQLRDYMVMQVDEDVFTRPSHRGHFSKKHDLVGVWVCRLSDVGVGDQQYFTRTHLGRWLSVGDTVLGYDLANSNANNYDFDKIKPDNRPDVVLVKKMYDRQKRNRRRKWKLKHIADDVDTSSQDRDYTEFLEDLEEDDVYRQNVNVYKDTTKLADVTDDTDDECAPYIGLEEMLDDLHLDDVPMSGDEGE